MEKIINNKIIPKMILVVLLVSIIINTLIPITANATGNESDVFGDEYKFNYNYISDGELPYAIYEPQNIKQGESIPLIVWLHGQGEFAKSQSYFESTGLPAVLNNWKLKGFKAYVVCPHSQRTITSETDNGWDYTSEKNKLQNLLEKIIQEKNIDRNNIILSGHSSGANGAVYMLYEFMQPKDNTSVAQKEYFSKCALLSAFGVYSDTYGGYDKFQQMCEDNNVDIRAYAGTMDIGGAKSFPGKIAEVFGEESAIMLENIDHAGVPKAAFTMDKDGDGCSDLIEWMLGDYNPANANKISFFDENITFSGEFVENEYDSGEMSYALYTPSNASKSESVPLLVWLHGSGEVRSRMVGDVPYYCSKESFLQSGLPKILNEWDSEGFNAYVLCPQLKGHIEEVRWSSAGAKNRLKKIIDKIISTYNIDTDNIVIAGHSLGGAGTLYMTHPSSLGDYFSRTAILSGITPGININEIEVEAICYTEGRYFDKGDGKPPTGEFISYMKYSLIPAFGQENCLLIEGANHSDVPEIAFSQDDGSFVRNRTEITVPI